MELHEGESVLFEGRPSWRAILGFYIVGALVAAAVGAVVGLVSGTVSGGGVFVVLAVLVVLVGWLRRLGTRYAITSERLWIQRGLLSRHTQETRLTRVQNVNTDQTVLQRMLGVGIVDFDTAGTDAPDSEFAFRGVADPANVAKLVDAAVRRSQQARTS
jgi:uncharacterized membrane protein YdbT with pleckstrin-like domain